METALRDYADEASRILHLAADMTRDAMRPVEARAEELLHEIDERAGSAAKPAASKTSAKSSPAASAAAE